jgi:hypothetical protein
LQISDLGLQIWDLGLRIALVSGEGVSRITRDCRLRIADCGLTDHRLQIADFTSTLLWNLF